MLNLGCIGKCDDLALPGAPTAVVDGTHYVIITTDHRVSKRLVLEAGDEIKIPAALTPDQGTARIQILTPGFQPISAGGDTEFEITIKDQAAPGAICCE